MYNKSCYYYEDVQPGHKRNGKLLAFVSHTFNGSVKAAAIIEDDKTGLICVVPAVNVRFTIEGNMDKR